MNLRWKLHWARHSARQWFWSPRRIPYRAAVALSRLVHRRAYRLLPEDLKDATLADAIDRLAHDRWVGERAEERAAEHGARCVELEHELACMRLQLSTAGIPKYKRILETFGLTETTVQ